MNYSLCASLALLLTISQAVAEATEELNEPTDNSKKKMPTGVIVAIVVVVAVVTAALVVLIYLRKRSRKNKSVVPLGTSNDGGRKDGQCDEDFEESCHYDEDLEEDSRYDEKDAMKSLVSDKPPGGKPFPEPESGPPNPNNRIFERRR